MQLAVTLWQGEINDLIRAHLAGQGTRVTGDIVYSYIRGRAKARTSRPPRIGNDIVIDTSGAYLKASCPTASGVKEVYYGTMTDLIRAHLKAKNLPATGEVEFSYVEGRDRTVGKDVILEHSPYLCAYCEVWLTQII
jgi:hypothetical protein